MIYNIKFDENDYVVDLTQLSPAPSDYIAVEIGDIPHDVMCGCYKLVDGLFVLDEDKKTQWENDQIINEPEIP